MLGCQATQEARATELCGPDKRCGRGRGGWNWDAGGCGNTKAVFSDCTGTLYTLKCPTPSPSHSCRAGGHGALSGAVRRKSACPSEWGQDAERATAHSFIQDSENSEWTSFHRKESN